MSLRLLALTFALFASHLMPAVAAAAPPSFEPELTMGRDASGDYEAAPSSFRPDGTFRVVVKGSNLGEAVTMLERTPMAALPTPVREVQMFGSADGTPGAVAYAENANGDAAVAWSVTRYGDTTTYSVNVSTRAADAAAWSTPVELATSFPANRPLAAVTAAGRVVVGWTIHDATAHEAWTATGTIGGGFGAPAKFADLGSYGEAFHSIAARGDGDVFAVHTEDATIGFLARRVYLSRMPAGQLAAWDAKVRIDAPDGATGEMTSSSTRFSVVFAEEGQGSVVWGSQGESDRYIVKRRSIGADGAVGADVDVLNPTGHAQVPAAMYDTDGVLMVSWAGSATGSYGTYKPFLYQQAPGQPATTIELSSIEGQGFDHPSIAQASVGGRTVVAWRQQVKDTTDTFAWAVVREPGATSFGDATKLTAAVDPYEVAVRADEFDVVVTWLEGWDIKARAIDDTPPMLTALDVPTSATAGVGVNLSVQATDTWSVVPESGVTWNINGVSNGSGRTLSNRAFPAAGTYEVEVTAADAAGNVRTGTRQVSVAAAPVAPVDDTTPLPPVVVQPEPPSPFTFTDTTTRDKVPAVVGLKASTARDRFDRAGINVDFEIRMVSRAKAPRGITIGEVMAQTPRAGTLVETAIRDRQEVRLDVYAGPVVGRPSASGCAVAKVNAAVKGLELDLAKLVLKSMKCPYQVDVRPVAKGDDAAVTGATSKRGLITLGVNIPRKPTNNDVLLTFRENPNGISFDKDNWTLTAGQKNAFTFQATTEVLVKGKIPLIEKASVWIDMSGVGGARNLTGQTGPLGEKVTILEPPRAGYIDILVEYQAGNDVSLWGTARLKVVDRSGAKAGSTLATVSGRVFQKHRTGTWVHVPGASMPKSRARNARFLDFGAMVTWMQHAVAGIGGSIGSAFSNKGQSSEQVLSTALKHAKVSPSQVLIHDSLVSGNVKPIELRAADVVSAGGGNVVAAGGGNVIAPGGANVIAPGGANVISAGGGNVVAAGGGNVISAGGANGIAASAPGLIAMGAAGVISASGGNVIAPGGANVISAGGGNLLSDNGLGRRP